MALKTTLSLYILRKCQHTNPVSNTTPFYTVTGTIRRVSLLFIVIQYFFCRTGNLLSNNVIVNWLHLCNYSLSWLPNSSTTCSYVDHPIKYLKFGILHFKCSSLDKTFSNKRLPVHDVNNQHDSALHELVIEFVMYFLHAFSTANVNEFERRIGTVGNASDSWSVDTCQSWVRAPSKAPVVSLSKKLYS